MNSVSPSNFSVTSVFYLVILNSSKWKEMHRNRCIASYYPSPSEVYLYYEKEEKACEQHCTTYWYLYDLR